MRTIKFRGKRVKDGQWIYGNLADYSFSVLQNTINKKVIFSNIVSFATDNFGFVVNDCEVAPATVGQFTGLLDKNGKEIYEGDILFDYDFNEMVEVEYEEQLGAFILDKIPTIGAVGYIGSKDTELYCEIIGNIHDNPELMKGGTK